MIIKHIRNQYISIIMILVMLGYNTEASSQIKIGESNKTMNSDAMLEIESVNKGFLLPRVALVSTSSSLPLKTFTSGMIVYNTSTTNDLSTGLYYSDGTKWIKANNNSVTTGLFFNGQNHTETVTVDGQTAFKTPYTITEQTKIFLYRNGILILHTIQNNTIVSEIPCKKGDQIRIIQLL